MLLTLFLNFMIVFVQGATDSTGDEKASQKTEAKTEDLMNEVFNRFHINYEMSRTHKSGYYKETMIDTTSLCYLADGIVEIYVPSNLNDKDNASVYPIRTRKKLFKKIDEEFVLTGHASDMARSSVWRPRTFLSEKNRKDYSYRHTKDTLINGRSTRVIHFEPTGGSGISKGKLFVDTQSYAIVKMIYRPILTEKEKLWKMITWTEDFEFRNGAYELATISFRGVSKEAFVYEAFLAMEQLETISEIPSHLSFINEKFPIVTKDDENEEADLEFWEGYDSFKKYAQPKQDYLAQVEQ